MNVSPNPFHASYSGVTKNKPERIQNVHDYYPTPPIATCALLKHFGQCIGDDIWELAAGRGWIVKELERSYDKNSKITATDIHLYDNPICNTPIQQHDFLDFENIDYTKFSALITNPPYKSNLSFKFAQLALYYKIPFIALLQRLTFVEGERRYKELFAKNPPTDVLLVNRLCVDEGSNIENIMKNQQRGMIVYAWYIWTNPENNLKQTKLHWSDMKSIYAEWREKYKDGY